MTYEVPHITDLICREIAQERSRQITGEGWGLGHDDTQVQGELPRAASCYAWPVNIGQRWPWHKLWWKPAGPRRNLIKAAALLVAEIERLDRQTGD